jgi:hypothetical protein
VAPASAAAPTLRDEPAPPASPIAPKPPPRIDEPTPEDPVQSQSVRTSEETRNRQRKPRRERFEAEQSRQLTGEAVQSARLTDADREEIRRRVEELRTKARELAREAPREAGERARELSEKARRLVEEAEAERHAEEERRRLERIE